MGIEPNGLVEIGNGSGVVALFLVSKAAAEKGGDVFGIKLNCIVVIGNRPVVVGFFS